MQGLKRNILASPLPLSAKKVQMNSLMTVKVQVSPRPISILTTQTDKMSFIGPRHLSKNVVAKNEKQSLR